MSDTPRTDAVIANGFARWAKDAATRLVAADHARTLERELSAMTAERDRLLNRMASLQRGTLLAQAALKTVRASKEASAHINTEMVDALIRSIDAAIQGEVTK